MKITYYGHACFVVEAKGFRIALDPYDGSVPGYKPLKIAADAVYCSHEHEDHNYKEAVSLSSHCCGIPKKTNPFKVTELSIPHDDKQGELRGQNTARIFECEGKKVAHMGDTGCYPTPEQMEKLKGLDVILIPIGGYFTIDSKVAAEIIKELKPKMAIPMHFRDGELDYPLIADIKDCEVLLNQKVLAYGESIEL